METRPSLRSDEILDAYLSYIDGKTYEDSCVYHAPEGCRLPREMRAHKCNDYLCKELNQFRLRLDETSSRRGFVVAMVGNSTGRAGLVDGGQVITDEDRKRRGPKGRVR
jgi:hypothetical protein